MKHWGIAIVAAVLGAAIVGLVRQVDLLLADRPGVVRMAELPDGIAGRTARAVVLPGSPDEEPFEVTARAEVELHRVGFLNAVVERDGDTWWIRGLDR